jgi:hypothetical protein
MTEVKWAKPCGGLVVATAREFSGCNRMVANARLHVRTIVRPEGSGFARSDRSDLDSGSENDMMAETDPAFAVSRNVSFRRARSHDA